MHILRFPSLSDDQFRGCVAAFVDSLSGEFNAAAAALRRLEGQAKGSAFVHEIALDLHRYGALIVLERWGALVASFGPHLAETRSAALVETACDLRVMTVATCREHPAGGQRPARRSGPV